MDVNVLDIIACSCRSIVTWKAKRSVRNTAYLRILI